MSERPTPQEIAAAPGDGFTCLERLAEHGYRIVHPDDVPVRHDDQWPATYGKGWNDCRDHIFGEGT